MKTTLYGRLIFGGSAVLLGAIALLWHDTDTWQTLSELWKLPSGVTIGGCLMFAQIAGGIGIPSPRTARWASILLAVVYLLFSLACLPGVIAAPKKYEGYGSFFEQFSALCGAVALCAVTASSGAWKAALSRVARFGLGLCAVSFTLGQIFYFRLTASLVPKWIPPNQKFWAILTTVAFALAAIAILLNRQARLAAGLMTLMLALFGVLVWIPHLVAHPQAHFNWSEFGLTFLIAGAAWMVAELKG